MARVARKVRDKTLWALMGRYLRAGVCIQGIKHPTEIGTPQGGLLSPLLANILLDDFDKLLEKRGHRFARYADDVVILVKSQRAGERVMRSISRFLTQKLKLEVNQEKSQVVPVNQMCPRFYLPGQETVLARTILCGFSPPHPATDRTQLGCFHDLPIPEARAIHPRLDGLLRHF